MVFEMSFTCPGGAGTEINHGTLWLQTHGLKEVEAITRIYSLVKSPCDHPWGSEPPVLIRQEDNEAENLGVPPYVEVVAGDGEALELNPLGILA